MELDLNLIREDIDVIDKEIVSLFEKRMKLCEDVANYKISVGKDVLDRKREEEKIEKVKSFAKNEFNKNGTEELFTQIMAISRKLQYRLLTENGIDFNTGFTEIEKINKKDVKVVYQGVEGAYSYQATINYFGEDADMYNVSTFNETMKEVKDGNADYAVLPIENTTAGIVNDVYDLLVEYDNCIVDETDVIVRHALLGTKDSTIEDIDRVYSHPQGIMQCREYLDNYPTWQKIAQANTALSAKKVKDENKKNQAAIASTLAAKIYDLKILEENINKNDNNTTRFIIVSKNKIYTKTAKKVSLYFEIPHKSGTLYNILSHFIYNGLNMTKIESRPIKDKSWEYRFFVEFEGDFNDSGTLNAIRGIREEASFIRILGNY
ncbi:chorismate mutase / prephenate dehydratase [Lachnospiraceae bacterium RM5]|nr:chorismate mutase / prephenate dehydratase [Lachnospiraceae bacterium RM5]